MLRLPTLYIQQYLRWQSVVAKTLATTTLICTRYLGQGTLTEGEGSVQFTSALT